MQCPKRKMVKRKFLRLLLTKFVVTLQNQIPTGMAHMDIVTFSTKPSQFPHPLQPSWCGCQCLSGSLPSPAKHGEVFNASIKNQQNFPFCLLLVNSYGLLKTWCGPETFCSAWLKMPSSKTPEMVCKPQSTCPNCLKLVFGSRWKHKTWLLALDWSE